MADVKIVTKAKAGAVNAIIHESEIEVMTDDLCKVYDYFELNYNRYVLRDKIVADSWNTKAPLLEIFEKSPYYVGKGRVVIDTTLERKIDLDAWGKCYCWLRDRTIERKFDIYNTNPDMRDAEYELTVFLRKIDSYVLYKSYEVAEAKENIASLNYIDPSAVEGLNEWAERCGLKLRAKANQKFTKVIAAYAKETGLDTITDIRDVSFTDNDGNFHERTKDFGWKKIQAEIGDALNVIEVKSPMVISVNTTDIATMSCGDSWASCHFIGAGHDWMDNDSYSGCYSGGNIGYMRDSVSFICFTIKENTPVDDWKSGKTHRAVFAYEDGVLYEGRVYPDGRDGGDETIAVTMRNFVQKLIADGLNENNIWTVKKGASWTSSHVRGARGYCGYHDWRSCEDGNMSFLQKETTDMDHIIEIGTFAVCADCGCTHTNSKCVLCERCWKDGECDICGESISTECDDYIEYNGCYYCCRACAQRAGLCYAEDLEEWTPQEYCRQDACTDDWYYYNDDGIFTSDGNWYHNMENAMDDGYEYAQDDGEWYFSNELYQDDYDGYYYHDESEKVVIGDHAYHNLTNALRDGWSEEDIELGREAV